MQLATISTYLINSPINPTPYNLFATKKLDFLKNKYDIICFNLKTDQGKQDNQKPMGNQLLNVIIYATLAGLATVVGIYLVLWKEEFATNNSISLISFAAGVLLSTSIAHLIPESLEISKNPLPFVLASFLAFYLLEQSIILHSCQEGAECEIHPIGTISLVGIGFHSLLDGIVIGAGFEISTKLGVLAAISVLLHELPEGISTISILLHMNYEKSKAIIYSWLVALATPVGAILTYFFLKNISEHILGIFLAIAAGSFLYVAASDLIPEIHRKSRFLNVVLIFSGALVPFAVSSFFK